MLFWFPVAVVAAEVAFATAKTLTATLPVRQVRKGISYGPLPCKGGCHIEQDDFMSEAAKPLWGSRGRGDLQVIRELGADSVRLYGNNPEEDHRGFLDEAHRLGLGVVVGMSDYPYTQMGGSCLTTGLDCSSQLRNSYLGNLKHGFLQQDRSYHPALSEVIVINEPDLKLPGMGEPALFCRGIISAIDGMLEAEKDAGVTGHLINFTVAFSFGVCSRCTRFADSPALGQMSELEEAMLNPWKYGYTPKNDLAGVYRTRFHHSFNTANPARHIRPLFLDKYESAFPSVPVIIQEYHAPGLNTEQDVSEVLGVAETSSLLRGISFFEFQVRYDKGGLEMAFGLFGLGDYAIDNFAYPGGTFGAWCLVPRVEAGASMPAALAAAFGGAASDFEAERLCAPDPAKVPLTEAGYAQIRGQGPDKISVFLNRLLEHSGGHILDRGGLDALAVVLVSRQASFNDLVNEVAARPSWAAWPANIACVADRLASLATVGPALSWVCGQMLQFNCSNIPLDCASSLWDSADYAFGVYYQEHGGDPLQSCSFNGSATMSTASDLANHQPSCLRPFSPDGVVTLPTAPKPGTPATELPKPSPSQEPTLPSQPSAGADGCTFAVPPVDHHFWDPSCLGVGGAGCRADGIHDECRFCGAGPFLPCPGGEKSGGTPLAPPSVPSQNSGGCSFAVPPLDRYFWDSSCQPGGGVGCLADGVHLECRFCGSPPLPPCHG